MIAVVLVLLGVLGAATLLLSLQVIALRGRLDGQEARADEHEVRLERHGDRLLHLEAEAISGPVSLRPHELARRDVS